MKIGAGMTILIEMPIYKQTLNRDPRLFVCFYNTKQVTDCSQIRRKIEKFYLNLIPLTLTPILRREGWGCLFLCFVVALLAWGFYQ